ncbi:uncharacterized protein LOC108677226 [Hyalella azteca]|uniref:Uncharacterized protein LOC108677226 n=1 Tax=Hyalella azteca TaxID=294128 RepID=A0A8B7P4M5_HYAAZ|nr:uncharacterized protein LOC108677226 [Hyalella azteca]
MARSSFLVLMLALAGANAAIFSACSRALGPTMSEGLEFQKAQLSCYMKEIQDQATTTFVNMFLPKPLQLNPDGGFFGDMPSGFEGTSLWETLKDPSQFFENMNVIPDAKDLRKCVADKLGLIGFSFLGFSTFDDQKLRDQILAKVKGTDLEANVKKGISNCGKVSDFKVSEYMDCITSYCETGEAPH